MKIGMAAVGQTKFTMKDGGIERLLLEAVRDLLSGSGADAGAIDCVLVSTNDEKRYLGAVLSELAGIGPRISHTIESMCGSGGSALVSAYSYVKSGLSDAALVVGAERPESPGGVLDWDASRGQFRSPVYWGSIMSKSYKRRHSVSPETLAAVPAKNRAMAMDNPHSLCGGSHTISDILESRRITEDLRLLECSRTCAGSAAVLVASEGACRAITDAPVWIEGLSQCTLRAGFGSPDPYHAIPSIRRAAGEAYRMAGVGPGDIDVAEVHDAFAVCEPMALESLGMAPPGGGARMCGELHASGSRRVNPRGGILGSGHPLGATGVAQAAEVFLQLRGEAGRRQADGAAVGLTQGMSAAGTSSVVAVMRS